MKGGDRIRKDKGQAMVTNCKGKGNVGRKKGQGGIFDTEQAQRSHLDPIRYRESLFSCKNNIGSATLYHMDSHAHQRYFERNRGCDWIEWIHSIHSLVMMMTTMKKVRTVAANRPNKHHFELTGQN